MIPPNIYMGRHVFDYNYINSNYLEKEKFYFTTNLVVQ
jgi:hypothetical protein